MAKEYINIDFESAYAAVNKALPALPEDNANNYADEWLTTGCVGTLFTDIDSTMVSFEQTVNAMRTYLNRLNELAGAPQPELPITNLGDEFTVQDYNNNSYSNPTKLLYNLGYDDLPEYTAITKNVNVRTKPGTDGEVIETLPSGTEVTVVETGLGANQAWNLVSYEGKDGLTHFAYISSTSNGSEILTPKEDSGVTSDQVNAAQQFVRDNQNRKPGMAETAPRFAQGTGEAKFQKGTDVTINESDDWVPRVYEVGDNSLGDYCGHFPNGTKVKVEGEPIITENGWTAIKVKLEEATESTDGGTIPAGTYYIPVQSGYNHYVEEGTSRTPIFDIPEGGDS